MANPNAALRSAVQNTRAPAPAVGGQSKSLAHLMSDPKIKAQMALALPKHLNADRMARIALTEIRKVPALAQCNQESFLGAIMQCAQLGLEPGGVLGHAYLLPFGNGKAKDGLSNVQLIIGYRGMIDLARRSGQIISISAHTVHEHDTFSYQLGLDPDIKHIPTDSDRGAVTHVYAVAKLKDGGVQFEVMSRHDVEQVRKQSKASTNGPWVTHWDEMAKKTVCRRLFKWLPVSIEMQTAVAVDEQADRGTQDNASFITGEYEHVVDYSTGEIMQHDEQPAQEQSPMFADALEAAAKGDSDTALDLSRSCTPAEKEVIQRTLDSRAA